MTSAHPVGGDGEALGYGQALDELEDLLDELEGADVDVDVLAERVARGVELIRFCRARLDVVTEDVDAVVSELVSLESGSESTGGTTTEATPSSEGPTG